MSTQVRYKCYEMKKRLGCTKTLSLRKFTVTHKVMNTTKMSIRDLTIKEVVKLFSVGPIKKLYQLDCKLLVQLNNEFR